MKRIIILLIAISLAAFNAYAAETQAQFLSSSDVLGKYLGIEIGARSSGMGNADTVLISGAEALFINPANTEPEGADNSLLLSHNSWLGDVFQETAAYSRSFSGYGVGGIGFSYINEGKIDGYTTDSLGNPVATGTINPSAVIVKANYSNFLLSQLRVGLNLGFTEENIGGNTTSKEIIDLGVKYMDVIKGLSLGISAQNLGLAGSDYSVDSSIIAGLGYALKMEKAGDLNAELDVKLPNQNSAVIAAGIEYVYSDTLFARIGYEGDNSDVTGLKGIRFGLGLKYQKFNIDYCFEPYGDLGASNKLSLGFNF